MSPGHLRASTPEITATTPDGSVTYDNKVCVCLCESRVHIRYRELEMYCMGLVNSYQILKVLEWHK